MRVKFKARRKVRAGLDMTPFMDLSVNLVIFFMLTATFSKGAAAALDVDLPSASTASTVREAEEIKVAIDRQDNVSFDGRKVAFDALERIFRAGAAKSPRPEVLIGADRYASHGAVVRVMDAARRSGLDRFSIAAAKTDGGEGAAPAPAPAGRRAGRKDGRKHASL